MLSGQLPHPRPKIEGKAEAEAREEGTSRAATEQAAPALAQLVPGINPRLAEIVARCLARSPAARPESAEGLLAELEALQAELSSVTPGAVLRRAAARSWPLLLVLAALVLVPPLIALKSLYRQRAAGPSPSGPVKARRSIAMLPLSSPGREGPARNERNERTEPLRAFSELLGDELSIGAQLRRLPDENVASMQLELGLARASQHAPEVLSAIRRYLGADLIAAGAYQQAPDGSVGVTVHVQDTQTGRTLATAHVTGGPGELFALVASTGRSLRQQLGLGELSDEQAKNLRAARPATPQMARLYALGLDRLHRFDAAGARSPLEQLALADPDFPLGHLALAEALGSLGYDQKAQAELRRAFELSQALAPEQRFLIEARYYLAKQEWARTFAAYRALLGAFPESLEYGLGLADAQLTANQSEEALATARSLRGRSERAQQDPRIDILEGRALLELGQSRSALAVLQRAAARGHEAGSPLLEARAHLESAYAFEYAGEHTQALQAAERAAPLYRRVGERGRLADALIAIAGVHMHKGDLARALSTARSALGVLIEIKNSSLIADHLGNIAMLLARSGHLDEALARAESAYLLARETDRQDSIGSSLVSLGWISLLQGDLARAEQSLGESRQVYEALANVRMLAWVKWHTGNLRLAQGRLDEARRLHVEALHTRQDNGLLGFAAESELALAELALEQAQPVEAAERARAAAQQFAGEQQQELEAQAQILLAQALLQQGSREAGEAALARALTLDRHNQNLISQLFVSRRALEMQTLNLEVIPKARALRELDGLLFRAQRAALRVEVLELQLLRLRIGTDLQNRKQELVALIGESKEQGLFLIAEKAASLVRD